MRTGRGPLNRDAAAYVVVAMVSGTGKANPPRRRAHASVRRPNRVAVTLTDDELADLRAVARRDGMAVAAWLGRAGMDAVRGRDVPASTALRDALEEVRRASARVREIGVLLNQAVARLHSTGRPGESLESAARIASRRLERLDEAVLTLLDAQ